MVDWMEGLQNQQELTSYNYETYHSDADDLLLSRNQNKSLAPCPGIICYVPELSCITAKTQFITWVCWIISNVTVERRDSDSMSCANFRRLFIGFDEENDGICRERI